MAWIGAVAAVALIVLVLLDAFATMILPRRVKYVYLVRLLTARPGRSGGRRRG